MFEEFIADSTSVCGCDFVSYDAVYLYMFSDGFELNATSIFLSSVQDFKSQIM